MTAWHWTRILAGSGVLLMLLLLWLVRKIRSELKATHEIAEGLRDKPVVVSTFEPPAHLDKKTLQDEHLATRSHMSHEMDSVRKAAEMAKAAANYAVDIVKKISEKFGIKPPNQPPSGKSPDDPP